MNHRVIAGSILASVIIVASVTGFLGTFANEPRPQGSSTGNEEASVLLGLTRPRSIPPNWIGEPLPNNEGWRWSDPKNRGNAVRIHRRSPTASNAIDRDTYVVVTRDGQLMDASGRPTGKLLRD
jgi:hypothetical protein